MDFEQGDPVIVYVPLFYREYRVGLVIEPCKDHDGGIKVLLGDSDAPINPVCVGIDKRDTIERLKNLNTT